LARRRQHTPHSAQVRAQQEKQEDSDPRIGSFKIKKTRDETVRHQEDRGPSMVSGQAVIKDIVVASKIWGKNILVLIGKTTRSKSTPVARDYANVPRELLQLHIKTAHTAALKSHESKIK
jgi:hypothetical protein